MGNQNFFKNIAKKFAVFKKGTTFVATNLVSEAINALYSISRLFLCLVFYSLKGRHIIHLICKIRFSPIKPPAI